MRKGIVYRSTGSWYLVKDPNGDYFNCRIKGKFRSKGIKSTNPIAVGDEVDFNITDKNDKSIGLIHEIFSRRNYIIRKSVNLSKQTHIIAANIDQVFLLVTLNNPKTLLSFVDRFLVSAKAYHIKVIIIFSKIDIYLKDDIINLNKISNIYEKVGYECYKISSFNSVDITFLKKLMKKKVNMIAGHSGVGKSTLLNSIDPKLKIKTSPISDHYNKGQHTTTFAQMYDVGNNIKVIDTPGIKGFGIVDLETHEIRKYFSEFERYSGKCKFQDCLHNEEPGCQIKEAVENKKISLSRYKNYISLIVDNSKLRN